MKQQITIITLLLLVLTAPSCRHDTSPIPLEFKAYAGNPILSPGEPGSWDELFIWSPQVIFDDSVFYLFYLGGNISGRMAIGLATSRDGYRFEKFPGNPLLSADGAGFDAFTVGPAMVLKTDSAWVMYYNAQDLVAFAPGHAAGRATAPNPYGPWARSQSPVISSGNPGEWDAGFIIPCSVLRLDDGSLLMYYSGGKDLSLYKDFYIGMASSPDGITWKKHNDPGTLDHPFKESDPVLITGDPGQWDGAFVWMANVTQEEGAFRMFYSGAGKSQRRELKSFGYAVSQDGVHWQKHDGNPIYSSIQDPFILSRGQVGFMENPVILVMDTICLLYYECGPSQIDQCFISMATDRVP